MIVAILGLFSVLLVLASFIGIIVSGIIFLIKKSKEKPRKNSKTTLIVSSGALIFGIVLLIIAISLTHDDSDSTKTASTSTSQSSTESDKNLPKVFLELDKKTFETNSKGTATITGKTEPGTQLVMTYDKVGLGDPDDTEKKDVHINKDGTFSITVNWETTYDFYAVKKGESDNEVKADVHFSKEANEYIKQQEEKKHQEEIAEGKKNAQTITYNHLKKNADDYIGKKYFITGKVAQAIEDGGVTLLRVDITNEGYGIYDDTVAVQINGKTDAVEDDIVQVFGTISGNYTYTSTINAEITIPGIDAKTEDVKVIK